MFFSVGNDGCRMGECGKRGKKWVRVGKSDIFLSVGKMGKGVGESGQKLNEVGKLNEGVWERVGRSG